MSIDPGFKVLKNSFLKANPSVTEKTLDKLVSIKQQEMDKALKKKGAIDNIGALHLVAQDYQTTLSIPSSSTNKTELEKYLDGREEIKEFYLFTWQKLEKRIQNCFTTIKNIDSAVYDDLQTRKCYPKLESIIEILFPSDKLQRPKNKKELEGWELQILEDIPGDLQKFFKRVYYAFTKNMPTTQDSEGFFQYNKEFKVLNAKLRYPDQTKNPHYDTVAAKRIGKNYDWTMPAKVAFEFMEYHRGVLEHLVANRNFEEHHDDNFARKQFDKADRTMSDPLTEMEHPSNYILLAGLTINCVYEFIELMQIWIDSNMINKKSRSA